ncbi:hypothetical protein [Calothrix rhizosoleniae]|uniref:hypothetical protein n=1 Tax=Calothrix rhizosoleniae TaxID=888997 RepID=UPI000B49BAB2|nr:hypothetical protein [Calothrix rhizosoleniae]
MSQSTHNPSDHSGLELLLFQIPQSFLLQLGTVSTMALLVATKATSETFIALGTASEELFRGERLPILNFPEPSNLQE